ncbi:MAG: DUF6580 family putative transport protein [Pseudomonadota bacterium]
MKKLLVALVSVLHLVPHPFGVSPVGAMALYAGAHAPASTAWLVPVAPLTLAALLFGFYDPIVMAFVFGGFALASFVGRWLLRDGCSYARFAAAVGLGAIVFFLVSNFAMWLVGMYPQTLTGLIQCYINGLPFLLKAVLADAAYCFVLFGLHALIDREQREPVIA